MHVPTENMRIARWIDGGKAVGTAYYEYSYTGLGIAERLLTIHATTYWYQDVWHY